MSKFEQRNYFCPNCDTKHSHDIAISLNVTKSPEFKIQILNEQFQNYQCSQCLQEYQVDDAFIYTDFTNEYWIGVFPLAWEKDWKQYENMTLDAFKKNMTGPHVAAIAVQIAPGFQVKSVFGLMALKEKILCLDHHINEAVLAVMVLDMMRTSDRLAFHPDYRPRLIDVSASQLQFKVKNQSKNPAQKWLFFEHPRNTLDLIEANEQYQPIVNQLNQHSYIDTGAMMIAGCD